MKQLCRWFTIVLLFIGINSIGDRVHAADIWVAPANTSTPVYFEWNGALYEMGALRKGEAVRARVSSTHPAYYELRFGNGIGLVEQKKMRQDPKAFRGVVNNRPNTTRVIYTTTTTKVFDNSTGSLREFATIQAGFRYPVIGEFGNWWKIDVGGREGYVAKFTTSIDEGIPVLMYHHILKPEEKKNSPFANVNTTMTTVEFEQQMKYLADQQFTTITSADLERYLDRKQNLPARAVLITLDDGNISSRVYAYPILKKYGHIADQFIITSRTPATPQPFDYKLLRFLSEQEMDDMSDVYAYHGHTHNLHNLTIQKKSHLVVKSDAEIVNDLKLNRELLKGTRYLAYPFGQTDHRSICLLREAGFTMAYTTKGGRTTLGMNKMMLPRYGIDPNLSLSNFSTRVKLKQSITNAKPLRPVQPVIPQPLDPDQPFPDVNKDHYFYSYVKNLKERHVVQGFPDGLFRPYSEVTRGQAAKMLTLALGLQNEQPRMQQFTDVPTSHQYYDAIAILVQHGAVSGYEDGTFRPNAPLKRSQMSKIIVHLLQLPLTPWEDGTFADMKGTEEFASFVQTLKQFGITEGSDGLFKPYETVTRAQLSAFIRRGEAALQMLPPLVPEEDIVHNEGVSDEDIVHDEGVSDEDIVHDEGVSDEDIVHDEEVIE